MISVDIDLVAYGYQPPEPIGRVIIGNDGTGSHEIGNYIVKADTFEPEKEGRMRLVAPVGRLEGNFGGFPRQSKNVLYLLRDALDAVLKDKEQTNYDKVVDFMRAFGQPVEPVPTLAVDETRAQMRCDLIKEEYEELVEAVGQNDLVGIADALADLLYVVYGAAATWGIPIQEVFAAVHDTNMAKLDPETGKPNVRADGKVIKPEGWEPPTRAIEALVGAS